MRRAATYLVGTEAVAAVEFAVLFPVILVLSLVALQVAAYISAVRKVERIGGSVAQVVSQAAPADNTTTTAYLTSGDLTFAYNASMLIFPYILRDSKRKNQAWFEDISVSISSVQFTQKSTNCHDPSNLSACYTAQLAWTTSYHPVRACGVPLTPTPNTSVPSGSSLPQSVFGPGSLIVVDVVFQFAPTFAANLIPPITIRRSAYMQPRYASLIKIDPTQNDGTALICPGYQ